ncbi:CGCGG family putative rSAM-modified RiPP protein [Halopiger djelfimassiliensis]|uniref:CGCGG family putative rSAM-modified RiPP protein n=1 Tax=Halopiger djelfimassiliensis TaxID=1293047 RepID=UPI0006777820|nr:CGCGG family rSAM-modified RiPP protein [Halopiger djelfimassiliensis]
MTEDAADVEPVTRRDHDVSWSANLEQPRHADDRDLVVEQAKDAVAATATGCHVNLVTHGDHGHPETYLWEPLAAAFDDRSLEFEYVDRCGCGGHVTRVFVGGESVTRGGS